MGRAPCCEKVGLRKGRWTAEEDQKLSKYIQEHGEGAWRSLPKNAGLLRCGKSCRLRWINYLRADLKRGNISAEEDEIIIQLQASLGNRWSLMATHLPGRTDNEIKNYWNSHLSRKIQTFRRPSTANLSAPVIIDDITRSAGSSKRQGAKNNRRSSAPKSGAKDKARPANEGLQVDVPSHATPTPQPVMSSSCPVPSDNDDVSVACLIQDNAGCVMNSEIEISAAFDSMGSGSGGSSMLSPSGEAEKGTVEGGPFGEDQNDDACNSTDRIANHQHQHQHQHQQAESSCLDLDLDLDLEQFVEGDDRFWWADEDKLYNWLCEDHNGEESMIDSFETEGINDDDMVAWLLS